MRTALLTVLCISLLSFEPPLPGKKAKKVPVSGTVTETRSYCGGARPNDAILAQCATPLPLAHKKIYIKSGEKNSSDSKVILALTSDSNGNFRTKLKPGKYIVVDASKKDVSHYKMLLKKYKDKTESYWPIDTLCLKEWFLEPAGIFEVTGQEVKKISVNFHKECHDVPCARFRGPLPQ